MTRRTLVLFDRREALLLAVGMIASCSDEPTPPEGGVTRSPSCGPQYQPTGIYAEDVSPGDVVQDLQAYAFVGRLADGRFYAISRRCTHQGYNVERNRTPYPEYGGADVFKCVGHCALFAADGTVLRQPGSSIGGCPPAPESAARIAPLPFMRICFERTVLDDGRVRHEIRVSLEAPLADAGTGRYFTAPPNDAGV